MHPKTEKRPYLAGFLIKYKHIAWPDKRCMVPQLHLSYFSIWSIIKQRFSDQKKLTCDRDRFFLKGEKASVLQLPERVEFIDEMPYAGAQKLDKRFLRQDIEKKLQADQ